MLICSLETIDPRVPTKPRWSASGFRRPGGKMFAPSTKRHDLFSDSHEGRESGRGRILVTHGCSLSDNRPSHPYIAVTEHVGFRRQDRKKMDQAPNAVGCSAIHMKSEIPGGGGRFYWCRALGYWLRDFDLNSCFGGRMDSKISSCVSPLNSRVQG